jgi:hypothetical protein
VALHANVGRDLVIRAGARWAATENFTVDLSRAHSLRGPVPSNWTLGATWLIDRR